LDSQEEVSLMKTQSQQETDSTEAIETREPNETIEEELEMMMILNPNLEEDQEMTSLIIEEKDTIVLRREIPILETEEEDSIEMMMRMSQLREDQGIHLDIQEEIMRIDTKTDNLPKTEDLCLMKNSKSRSLKLEKPFMTLKSLKTTFL